MKPRVFVLLLQFTIFLSGKIFFRFYPNGDLIPVRDVENFLLTTENTKQNFLGRKILYFVFRIKHFLRNFFIVVQKSWHIMYWLYSFRQYWMKNSYFSCLHSIFNCWIPFFIRKVKKLQCWLEKNYRTIICNRQITKQQITNNYIKNCNLENYYTVFEKVLMMFLHIDINVVNKKREQVWINL